MAKAWKARLMALAALQISGAYLVACDSNQSQAKKGVATTNKGDDGEDSGDSERDEKSTKSTKSSAKPKDEDLKGIPHDDDDEGDLATDDGDSSSKGKSDADGDDDGDAKDDKKPDAKPKPSTIGVWNPADASFLLRSSLTSGAPDFNFSYGLAGWIPLVGDWDGDGKDGIAVYNTTSDPRDGIFLLKNDLAAGPADFSIAYGAKNWIPVVGDWDGDGRDTIGVYDTAQSRFLLRNSVDQGAPDVEIAWGMAGDIPVVGNWDGDKKMEVGIYRPSTAEFYLRKSDGSLIQFTSGHASYVPLIGDWDGDGYSDVGFYEPATADFILVEKTGVRRVNYGHATYKPLIGVWTK